MPSLSPDALERVVRRVPVTVALVATTLLLNLLAWNRVFRIRRVVLRSGSSELYPWCLVTYAFAVPYLTVLLVPINAVLLAGWGSAVESALGSGEYATYTAFTVLVTAVSTILIDKAIFSPLGRLTGALEVGWGNGVNSWTGFGHYMYWGPWPLAQVIVFALCRMRGVTTAVGPSWRGRRLTLQQLPLALVGCAAVLDVLAWILHDNDPYYYPNTWRDPDPYGWGCVVALISMFTAWLYERHASGTANAAFAFDAFFSPAAVRAVVRRAGEATHGFLRTSKLSFLLPPREAGATMPLPVFASAAAQSSSGGGGGSSDGGGGGSAALLPGTTAEEAEHYRLIAREALARRLQEQRQGHAETTTEAPAAASPPPAEVTEAVDDKTA